MGWKSLPYWLKGGIIFSILVVILFLYGLLGASNKVCIPENCIGEQLPFADFVQKSVNFLLIPLFPFMLGVSSLFNKSFILLEIFGLFIILLYIFIIGSLIGWIIGKVRSRGQVQGKQLSRRRSGR